MASKQHLKVGKELANTVSTLAKEKGITEKELVNAAIFNYMLQIEYQDKVNTFIIWCDAVIERNFKEVSIQTQKNVIKNIREEIDKFYRHSLYSNLQVLDKKLNEAEKIILTKENEVFYE